MDNKQKYILKILRKYGVLVNFTGDPRTQNLPSRIDGETFKQWKSRVLGDEVSDVRVYTPTEPRGNASMNRLAENSKLDFVKDILHASLKMKDEEMREELDFAEQEYKERTKAQRAKLNKKAEENIVRVRKSLESIGVDTLEGILNDIEGLQPSVRQFLTRFISEDRADIDTTTLLTKLIERHNYAAIKLRELKAAQADDSWPQESI